MLQSRADRRGPRPMLILLYVLALLLAIHILPPFLGLDPFLGGTQAVQEQRDPTACVAVGTNWSSCANAFSSNNAYASSVDGPGTAAAASTVVDLGAADVTAMEHSRKVFRNPRGLARHYVFYLDSADSTIKYGYSADGSVWTAGNSAAGEALELVTGDRSSWATAIHDDGSQLHVYLVYAGVTTNRLIYRHGTIADGSSTITWATEGNLGITSADAYGLSLSVASNGRLFAAWSDERTASELLRVYAWDAAPSGDAATGNQATAVEGVRLITATTPTGAADEAFVVYQEDTTILNGAKLTGSGSAVTIGTRSTLTGLTMTRGKISATVDTQSPTKVHVAYRDGSSMVHRTYNDASGFSSATTVLGSAPDSLSVAIDRTSTPDVVAVFYSKSGVSGDAFFRTSKVDSISFTTEVTINDDTEAINYFSTSLRDWRSDRKVSIAYTTQTSFLVRYTTVDVLAVGRNDTAWRNFGFTLGGGDTVNRVEVGVEWYRTSGAPILNVTVSWNGGSTWATLQRATNKSTDDNTVEWLNFTSATTWDGTKLSDASLRVRVYTNASAARLDYVTVRVVYNNQAPAVSNFRLEEGGGASRAGEQLDVDIQYFFIFNATDADAWSDVGQDGAVYLRLWFDGNASPEKTFAEQTAGGNYRIELRYLDTADPATATASEWSLTEGRATYDAAGSTLTAITSGPTTIGYRFKLALKLGFQVRQANDPTDNSAGAYNDRNSWNAEVLATDGLASTTLRTTPTGEHMEFGVFMYTFVSIGGDWTVTTGPGTSASTSTVTITRRSNDDFRMKLWFVTHLTFGPDAIAITNVQILAAADAGDNITSDTPIAGLGETNAVYVLGTASWYFPHSSNTDGDTTAVQFRVTIPMGTGPGSYTAALTVKVEQRPP